MLVAFFNIVKVESVPLNFNYSDQFSRRLAIALGYSNI
jgi:hypothetical protein